MIFILVFDVLFVIRKRNVLNANTSNELVLQLDIRLMLCTMACGNRLILHIFVSFVFVSIDKVRQEFDTGGSRVINYLRFIFNVTRFIDNKHLFCCVQFIFIHFCGQRFSFRFHQFQ